jgi:hypothetical protein
MCCKRFSYLLEACIIMGFRFRFDAHHVYVVIMTLYLCEIYSLPSCTAASCHHAALQPGLLPDHAICCPASSAACYSLTSQLRILLPILHAMLLPPCVVICCWPHLVDAAAAAAYPSTCITCILQLLCINPAVFFSLVCFAPCCCLSALLLSALLLSEGIPTAF